MRKKVVLYLDPKDTFCDEIRGFLEEHGIAMRVHDVRTEPLDSAHIARLLRNFDIKHFLNPNQRAYMRNKLDKSSPGREEVITMMAEDNELVLWPIIVAGRLMSVGPNRQAIKDMLQLNSNGNGNGNGSEPENGERPNLKRRPLKK